MRKLLIVTAAAAAFAAVPAFAQDAAPASAPTEAASDDAGATPRFEPYVGVTGGWERFDNQHYARVPQPAYYRDKLHGSLVQGVAGVNVPLGPIFVGVEGNVAKGLTGDVDWEYGGAARLGVRAGTGLIYGKVGYQWVNFASLGEDSGDYHAMTYGVGFEVGSKGMAQRGLRFRGEINTFGQANSIRPMAGLVKAF